MTSRCAKTVPPHASSCPPAEGSPTIGHCTSRSNRHRNKALQRHCFRFISWLAQPSGTCCVPPGDALQKPLLHGHLACARFAAPKRGETPFAFALLRYVRYFDGAKPDCHKLALAFAPLSLPGIHDEKPDRPRTSRTWTAVRHRERATRCHNAADDSCCGIRTGNSLIHPR